MAAGEKRSILVKHYDFRLTEIPLQNFLSGQRWLNHLESQMGLGTVISTEYRTVTIFFPATGETRTFSKQSAPLVRVAFAPGDSITCQNGVVLEVKSVLENEGLLTYTGVGESGIPTEIHESQLDHSVQLNRPTERLFSGQVDPDKWIEIRYQTLLHLNRLAHSDLRGLTGCRTSLIPHQLYIAHEVANRYAPRVLLADEVGLGKTIEAGLILHQQLLTGRATRILIVVPESLVHQWLVEMLRRFNLHFSILDDTRCQAIEQSTDQQNPFHSEQLVLCSLEFLHQNPNRAHQTEAGDWDLLVIDEAHHLQWTPENTSLQYQIIEQLAAVTKGLLLLTATPEQLGKTGHFARLRLLDPNRFHDLEAFTKEESSYESIAHVITTLCSHQELNECDRQTLAQTIKEGDNQALLDVLQTTGNGSIKQETAREELIEHLLDRHGTGRVLFRNTRATVKGFPKRQLKAYPLAIPKNYIDILTNNEFIDVQALISPEIHYQSTRSPEQPQWTQFDPRVDWLCKLLGTLKPKKVLIITASANSATDLAQALKIQKGIHAAIFHEHLSIVERDRAAAFFADRENGTQVLLCSEIGSEGRNFQFAHHLVLFDLPINPDLLEQRIGRLDRIGQQESINIHVPYIENSAQATLYRWYQEGLDAFRHTCPAGHTVYIQVEQELINALHTPNADIQNLIQTTKTVLQELNDALHRGRDRLLEYNSCRLDVANEITERALMQDKTSALPEYMDTVFDCFGVDTDIHSEDCYIIRPGNHMINKFPHLPDDGLTFTYKRNIALVKEDIHYLSWDHPMVIAAMDLIQNNELGNTAVTAVKYLDVKPGSLLMECLYTLEPASIKTLETQHYLPPTVVRVVSDETGYDHDTKLSHALIKKNQTLIDSETANKIIRTKASELKMLISNSETRAQTKAQEIRISAQKQTTKTLTNEINRLKALGQVNPNVRNDEVDFFEQQLKILIKTLDSAILRLDALRVIISV